MTSLPVENISEPRSAPHWTGRLAVLAIGILYSLISQQRTIGPGWLMLPILLILSAAITFARLREQDRLAVRLTWFTWGLIMVALVVSIGLLVNSLPTHTATAGTLLVDASLMWITNVLLFALCYWQIDDGGPTQRPVDGHRPVDFLFPQVTIGINDWTPNFIDYLFVAFNTSTAFSPTDTPVLSRRAKLLTMLQSSLSLVVLAILAARAINIF